MCAPDRQQPLAAGQVQGDLRRPGESEASLAGELLRLPFIDLEQATRRQVSPEPSNQPA
jgi:hypothetical protein